MATHQKKHIKQSGNVNSLRIKESIVEFYAIVKNPLGNCTFKCILLNNEEIIAKLCGKLSKQRTRATTVKENDLVLIEKDSLTKSNYILVRYSDADKNELKKMGENITSQVRTNLQNTGTQIHLESENVALEVREENDDINIDDI